MQPMRFILILSIACALLATTGCIFRGDHDDRDHHGDEHHDDHASGVDHEEHPGDMDHGDSR
jgi:hypothetical protein